STEQLSLSARQTTVCPAAPPAGCSTVSKWDRSYRRRCGAFFVAVGPGQLYTAAVSLAGDSSLRPKAAAGGRDTIVPSPAAVRALTGRGCPLFLRPSTAGHHRLVAGGTVSIWR